MAKRLFARAFPWLGWPSGWRVKWADDLPGAFGYCDWDSKLIVICRIGARDKADLHDTLAHEFCHMVYGPSVPHGRGFSARVRWAKHRAKVK